MILLLFKPQGYQRHKIAVVVGEDGAIFCRRIGHDNVIIGVLQSYMIDMNNIKTVRL